VTRLTLPRLLEVHEVAYQLKGSDEAVRRLIRSGTLDASRDGNKWRVEQRALEAYLERCRQAAVERIAARRFR
jgi:excisionase family DNA binding protein